jgi:O-acetyl-ADP-ribose deacetylase (regulator of RNase III)/tRNA A-37 threonylcarbamoyl transferase component Bud32
MTSPLSPGTPFRTSAASYDVLELIGHGGMGAVYRGRHAALNKEVAIKVLKADGDKQRFLREAQIAASVNSPHTVSVFDYHLLPDGSPIIIMEFVPGRSLADEIRLAHALPLEALGRFMHDAAAGLDAVSAVGIVHRDLKPSNLLIDRSDRVRIADFGLARADSPAAGSPVTQLTASGVVFGTPLYMSPEQAEDPHGTDVRSDIYSYGATFYHAATGVPPFEAPSLLGVLLKHKLETPAAPRSRRPDLSPRINDVIERCLAKSPADRFQSFKHVQLALGATGDSPWQEGLDPVVRELMARYARQRDAFWAAEGVQELAAYRLPNGRLLRIARGNIADGRADAIVSSDDESLTMGGGVSAALNARSGDVLRHEVKKFGRVRHGGVVVTGAGQLEARFVLHAVTIEYQTGGVLLPSRDVLLQIMAGCFYHADTLNLQSLVFPLLGTGSGGFSPQICLDTMVAHLAKTLVFGAHSVSEVTITLSAHSRTGHRV